MRRSYYAIHVRILEDNHGMTQDMDDMRGGSPLPVAGTEAALELMHAIWRTSSKGGQKDLKVTRGFRPYSKNFSVECFKHYDAVREPEIHGKMTTMFCAITGRWHACFWVEVASIVPQAFTSHNLGYVFGEGMEPMNNARNSLVLHADLEFHFNSGTICIVPDGPLDAKPIEWKVVVTAMMFMNTKLFSIGLRLGEIHNKRLTFVNENRPARRYLYFRYVFACFLAIKEGWAGPGLLRTDLWATPGKGTNYLRRSVVRAFAERIGGEEIPLELLSTNPFSDTTPSTSSEAADAAAAQALAALFESQRKGMLGGALSRARKRGRREDYDWDDGEDE